MSDGDGPDETPSEYDVTCATDGCMNEGITIRVTAPAEDPIVMCGPCGNQITNIVPAADEEKRRERS